MHFRKRSRHIGNFKSFMKTVYQNLDDLTKNNGIFLIIVLDDRTRRNRDNRLTLPFWGGPA